MAAMRFSFVLFREEGEEDRPIFGLTVEPLEYGKIVRVQLTEADDTDSHSQFMAALVSLREPQAVDLDTGDPYIRLRNVFVAKEGEQYILVSRRPDIHYFAEPQGLWALI
jgi:hypothetical protein